MRRPDGGIRRPEQSRKMGVEGKKFASEKKAEPNDLAQP
jgi:hypothetical protein